MSTDMSWALPIAAMFVAGFLLLIVQAVVAVWCVNKRERGLRAPNWLEWIAGYDSEQRHG